MDNAKTGKLIAEMRKKQDLTQQQLADKMNLSNKTISKWESGMGAPIYPIYLCLRKRWEYPSMSC